MGELTMNIRIEPEDIANRVLDEVEYKGRTIREWADCLSNPKNNADRIRAMSDEELAKRLCLRNHKCPPGYTSVFTPNCAEIYGCYDCWLDWLKSPAGDRNRVCALWTDPGDAAEARGSVHLPWLL